jgi:hypothetical protein
MDFLLNFFTTESTNDIKKVNFEDIQMIINEKTNDTVLINTLDSDDQKCLIKNTINVNNEVTIINKLMNNQKFDIKIIIYGKNSNCSNIYKKYDQLIKLGFIKVHIYIGGLFEWVCLQDIYGKNEFPTTNYELDILKYKPPSFFGKLLLKNIY